MGELVTFLASVNHTGWSSMEVGIKVLAEEIPTRRQRHVNSCHFTMVAVEDGRPVAMPELALATEVQARRHREAELHKSARLELSKRFAVTTEVERQTGHKVAMSWGPSSGNSPEASPVRVRRGEALDVLIMVDAGMDDLVRSGHFVPQHRRNVAVSGIGVAVKTGRRMPDISTTDAFRQALLAAKSVGCSEGASGTYFIKVIAPKLGLTEAMRARAM